MRHQYSLFLFALYVNRERLLWTLSWSADIMEVCVLLKIRWKSQGPMLSAWTVWPLRVVLMLFDTWQGKISVSERNRACPGIREVWGQCHQLELREGRRMGIHSRSFHCANLCKCFIILNVHLNVTLKSQTSSYLGYFDLKIPVIAITWLTLLTQSITSSAKVQLFLSGTSN